VVFGLADEAALAGLHAGDSQGVLFPGTGF